MSVIQYEEIHRNDWEGKDTVIWWAVYQGWKIKITSDFYVTILNFDLDGGRIAMGGLSSLDDAQAFVQQQFEQMAGRGIAYGSAYVADTPGSDHPEEGKGARIRTASETIPTAHKTIPAAKIEYVSDGSFEGGQEDVITYIPVIKTQDLVAEPQPEVVEEVTITDEDVESAWFAGKYDGYGYQFGELSTLTPNEQDMVITGRELLKHYKLVRGERSMYPSKRGLEDCVAMTVVPSGFIAGSEVSVYVGLMPKATDKGKALKLYIPAGYAGKIDQLMMQLTSQGVDLTDQRGNQSISALFRHLIDGALEATE